MESLGFPIDESIAFANTENFTASFPIACFFVCFVLFCFVCQIALARTSSTMLNRNVESGHLCLVPDLREKFPTFYCRM